MNDFILPLLIFSGFLLDILLNFRASTGFNFVARVLIDSMTAVSYFRVEAMPNAVREETISIIKKEGNGPGSMETNRSKEE
jgi:hypothetical protein